MDNNKIFENEEFKTVPGFTQYQVSNKGRVKSFVVSPIGRFLNPRHSDSGYVKVLITNDEGKPQNKTIHSIVMRAFVGNYPSNKHVINHKNGNKAFNRLENLEYILKTNDTRHAYDTNLKTNKGIVTSLTKSQAQEIIDLNFKGTSYTKLALQFKVSKSTIARIINGRILKF
jgi:hypothetical protein